MPLLETTVFYLLLIVLLYAYSAAARDDPVRSDSNKDGDSWRQTAIYDVDWIGKTEAADDYYKAAVDTSAVFLEAAQASTSKMFANASNRAAIYFQSGTEQTSSLYESVSEQARCDRLAEYIATCREALCLST